MENQPYKYQYLQIPPSAYHYIQPTQPQVTWQQRGGFMGVPRGTNQRPKSASRLRKEYILERSEELRLEERLYKCSKCELDLKFDDYGKRTREKLIGGSKAEICRNCRAEETKLTVGSKKWRKRKRMGTLEGGWKRPKKPKSFTMVVILKAEDVVKLNQIKPREMKSFKRVTKVNFVIDPLNEGAIEQTGSLTGTLTDMFEAAVLLGQLLADVKDFKRHNIEFSVDFENVGCLVGMGGNKVRKIREETGATVRISKLCLPGSSCVRVKVNAEADKFREGISRVIRQLSEGRKPTKMPYKPPKVVTVPNKPLKIETNVTK